MRLASFSRKIIVILMLCLGIVSIANASNSIDSVRVWPAPENTRIVFDLSQQPDFKYFSLQSPQRLVIDFKNSTNYVDLMSVIKADRRVKKIRTSRSKQQGTTRLVLELADNFRISVFPLAPAGQYGDRLVIDLYDKQSQTIAQHDNSKGKRDIVIAIVAGHGGEDPGSIGAAGTYEKRITLKIAQKLANLINEKQGLKAVMIRSGDYYVNHDRKTELARKSKADLLISIHADAFTSSQPNGASVLVQATRRADSEFSHWIQNREKNSELLGGAGATIRKTKDNNLAIALGDMKKEYTMASSYDFAEHVVKQLKKVTRLHKHKPERLSLAVLKSNDIPSVLIETGFISNPQEERRLNNANHQYKLAKAIYIAVDDYFSRNPPDGTLIAATRFREHRVSRGESLSVVAQRYKVSVRKLKSANNLTSNVVRIGQTLKIPQAD
ncbi:N-acetylmuramoyl-L-alanine amidase [Colwellia sp. MB02u-18]|uniref:N-acetylmuramoyl-L-alanine amidase n=1 Tax=unclassified Colwellia TaxID=196834 RepID=UPI0015F64D95|nr:MULTISPECIES: N-acetylmuramoyl-L-alanine amidase [unclassified Colwellia]MBA6225871.1 N-acetylmuramoyl-L-alanine amidase [Colwellia sp. MB3u-45]MBA6267107.1 N-acetylmuramoyl-L-alanine amidase [Colwellia sp. MB3u-43]MBA6322031.1 N-acetylmuramoyl-L-alanine amidase [Colwellia sp. MB02u-19]MBA6325261.1 N-acetylmuramoyl-L-alanine amidase [Colwellia sp. MB02u-18]MBA6330280.1 N-acetylmuramoyl-L-alanine amidase [Colwellia sp. MB02u-12]